MNARKKVKIIRAANGCYRYLLVRHKCPYFLSKAHYRSVGDAKSAGKAKLRVCSAPSPARSISRSAASASTASTTASPARPSETTTPANRACSAAAATSNAIRPKWPDRGWRSYGYETNGSMDLLQVLAVGLHRRNTHVAHMPSLERPPTAAA